MTTCSQIYHHFSGKIAQYLEFADSSSLMGDFFASNSVSVQNKQYNRLVLHLLYFEYNIFYHGKFYELKAIEQ